MKPQFKPEEIYIDLSKLSEEQQRKVIALLPEPEDRKQYEIIKLHFILYLDEDNIWWVFGTEIKNKTELTYSQFLDMMGESEEKSEKERINSDGTLYIGEGLENYYKDQLERTGKFKVVAIDATSEEALQVENNLNADDLDFVTDALNFYFHDAHNNLERKVIGDIEKKNYQYQLEKSKKLIKKLAD